MRRAKGRGAGRADRLRLGHRQVQGANLSPRLRARGGGPGRPGGGKPFAPCRLPAVPRALRETLDGEGRAFGARFARHDLPRLPRPGRHARVGEHAGQRARGRSGAVAPARDPRAEPGAARCAPRGRADRARRAPRASAARRAAPAPSCPAPPWWTIAAARGKSSEYGCVPETSTSSAAPAATRRGRSQCRGHRGVVGDKDRRTPEPARRGRALRVEAPGHAHGRGAEREHERFRVARRETPATPGDNRTSSSPAIVEREPGLQRAPAASRLAVARARRRTGTGGGAARTRPRTSGGPREAADRTPPAIASTGANHERVCARPSARNAREQRRRRGGAA